MKTAPMTAECTQCKIVDVQRKVPSPNGRFDQVKTEKKAICEGAMIANSTSCCMPVIVANPAK